MNIVIVTTAKTDEESKELLRMLECPFGINKDAKRLALCAERTF